MASREGRKGSRGFKNRMPRREKRKLRVGEWAEWEKQVDHRHSHAELGQSAAVLFSVAFLQRRASAKHRAGRLEQGLSDVEHAHDVGCSTPRTATGKSPRSHRGRWRRWSS